MRRSRTLRIILTILGALVILGIGLYGPATLIGPLPSASVQILTDRADVAPAAPPALPAAGASSITLGADDAPLAQAGMTDAVPMGGTAKIVAVLVTLAERPLAPGAQGPVVRITAEDYAGYLRYIGESARTVSFIEGEDWTQRQLLQAILLGSSNNHADALARWAFGSVDAYLDAADAWLAAKGFAGTTVKDATGLSEWSQSTGSDMARLTALAFAEPTVASIITQKTATLMGGRVVDNGAAYRAADGITILSRSFTDQAGLCVLFAADVAAPSGTARVFAAFLREPDYDTLSADLTALLASAPAGLAASPVVSEGEPFARFETLWGDSAQAVAASGESRLVWSRTPVVYDVTTSPQTVVAKGAVVGSVTVALPGENDVTVLLRTDKRISDPGILWRLSHPVPMIEALLDSLDPAR